MPMIINISRIAAFQECRRKEFNTNELRLTALREAEPLIFGGAFHKGVAHLFAFRDIAKAVGETEREFRTRYEGVQLLPEEQVLLEQSVELAKRMVTKFGEYYETADFTVLWPEVTFFVPLPGTEHHCYFVHRLLHPGTPFDACPHADCSGTPRPHYFIGKTDGVISWKKMIWLLEHKTSAMTGQTYFSRYVLDIQGTGYIYGVWKATGTRPHGFILNVAKKPNKRALDQFHVEFEREPYLRSDDDLTRFEREAIEVADDYERSYVEGKHYMNTRSCYNYNRRCYFFELCGRHNQLQEGEFTQREDDYVQLKYLELVGADSEVRSTP